MATETYTLEEVKKHSNGQDCWVVIDDKVYDITKFIDEHPGGEEVLLEQAGRDATIQFEDVGHSEDARELLADYLIGTVDKNDILKTDIGKTGKPLLSVEKGEDSSNFTMIVASLLVVGAAIASYFFYFNR